MIAAHEDVTAAARGDRVAFTRLVEAYGRTVCSISLAIVGEVAASEDVAQDVFLSVWQNIGKLRNPTSFLPWLRQLTRNAARGRLRGTIRRRRRIADAGAPIDLDRAIAEAADPDPDAATALALEQERALVAAAITELPDDAREVVLLFYREGQSAAQVADLLGLTEDAVKQRLSRARTRLRADLAKKLQQILVRTAPSGAFVAAIAGAIAIGAPATATAATLGKAGTAGIGAAGKLVTAGAALGFLGGTLGVLFGFWFYWRQARDDDERRGLKRLAVMNLTALVGLTAAVVIAAHASAHTDAIGDVALAGFLLTMGWTNLVWLPRNVIHRRLAAELIEDPLNAPRRQRRQRNLGIAGLVCGTVVMVISIIAQLAR